MGMATPMMAHRPAYATGLTAAQWGLIEPILPRPTWPAVTRSTPAAGSSTPSSTCCAPPVRGATLNGSMESSSNIRTQPRLAAGPIEVGSLVPTVSVGVGLPAGHRGWSRTRRSSRAARATPGAARSVPASQQIHHPCPLCPTS